MLQWWVDAGVDVLVGEEPRDWLKPKAPPAARPREPVAEAPALPGQLDLFRAHLADGDAFPFISPGAPRVCPSGDPASGLMILSDMPAAEDCAAGTLLSGEAGRLFDRMLAAIGRDRASIYLAALSCLRSPTGTFTGDSASQCATLARHHIGLAAPRVLLLIGDKCAHALLGLGVTQARGRWHQILTHCGQIPAIVTFHPQTLLESPRFKAAAWEDLQIMLEGLDA